MEYKGKPVLKILFKEQPPTLLLSCPNIAWINPTNTVENIHELAIESTQMVFLCVLKNSIFKQIEQILSNDMLNTCATEAKNDTPKTDNRTAHVVNSTPLTFNGKSDKAIKLIPYNKSEKLKLNIITEFCGFLPLKTVTKTTIAAGKFVRIVNIPNKNPVIIIGLSSPFRVLFMLLLD